MIHNPDHSLVCCDCHTTCKRGWGIRRAVSSLAVGILFCTFITVGAPGYAIGVLVIGLLSLAYQYKAKCPACRSVRLIPIDTPAGKKLLQ